MEARHDGRVSAVRVSPDAAAAAAATDDGSLGAALADTEVLGFSFVNDARRLGALLPPAAGSQYCLLRIEVNPNYAQGPTGPRAAARVTVRGTHEGLADGILRVIVAQYGGGA